MIASVDGLGAHGRRLGRQVGGKTGTAEDRREQAPHSWFIGFAPGDSPRYAIAVVMERAGFGSTQAAPAQERSWKRCCRETDMLRFFERVYAVVQMIPPGKVASYGQIAALLEHPRAARTVGWALHVMPDGSNAPWHRVVNSQGRYLHLQLQRPARPAAPVARSMKASSSMRPGCIDMRRFGWDACA